MNNLCDYLLAGVRLKRIDSEEPITVLKPGDQLLILMLAKNRTATDSTKQTLSYYLGEVLEVDGQRVTVETWRQLAGEAKQTIEEKRLTWWTRRLDREETAAIFLIDEEKN